MTITKNKDAKVTDLRKEKDLNRMNSEYREKEKYRMAYQKESWEIFNYYTVIIGCITVFCLILAMLIKEYAINIFLLITLIFIVGFPGKKRKVKEKPVSNSELKRLKKELYEVSQFYNVKLPEPASEVTLYQNQGITIAEVKNKENLAVYFNVDNSSFKEKKLYQEKIQKKLHSQPGNKDFVLF